MSTFEDYLKQFKENQEKNLQGDIQQENKNSLNEYNDSGTTEETANEITPLAVPPRKRDTLYEVYNPQGFNYKGITLEDASNNSVASGKYITADGEIADLNLSGFQTLDGKLFGANGLVYAKPLEGHAATWITDQTEGTWASYLGRFAAQVAGKYDPATPLRVLVPGINPENGTPILKEEIGTRKELAERNIAISNAYGFQTEEDGFLDSFFKGLFNTLSQSDEMVLGAARMLNPVNEGLKNAHLTAIEKNRVFSRLPSKESEETFTWDWFGQGLGNAIGSQAQFGYAGRIGSAIGTNALRFGGNAAFQDFAKRQMVEKLSRYGASGLVGFGYAMSEATKAGLDDGEAWMFSLAVGGINSVIESKLNVDFDNVLMANSTRTVTRSLLNEINGEFTSDALNRAGKSVLQSVLTGGKTALKMAGTETMEEIMQTGVEQTGRIIHDLFAKDRERGSGRFENTRYDIGEILEAGFFGAMASAPTGAISGIRDSLNKDSYMERMIREGKGGLILSGIDNLLATGKINRDTYEKVKGDAFFKVEVFEKNKAAFFNLRNMSNSRRLEQDLYGLLKQKASYLLENESLLAKLGKNPEENVAISKQQADAIKAEMQKVDSSIKDVQSKIDSYQDRKFVESENARYQKIREDFREETARVFESLAGPEVTASSFDELITRYESLSEPEKKATPLIRNATEAKMLVDAIRNGDAAARFEKGDVDAFIEAARAQLEVTRFYLHPSINTDENRRLLVNEIGIDEKKLPLTASEKARVLTDPSEFSGRYVSMDEIEMIFQSDEFQEVLNRYLVDKLNLDPENISDADMRMAQFNVLVEEGGKFGVTDDMIHSLDQTEEVLSLLETDPQKNAFRELLSKSDKPFSLLTDQGEAGKKTSGFHHALTGAVLLRFNKARLQELLAKKQTGTLTEKESLELKNLQDDLYHKLVHETSHNLFDYGIGRLFHAYKKYIDTGKHTEDSLLYQRVFDLANLAYHSLKGNPRAKSLYFFNTVGFRFENLSQQEKVFSGPELIKEFYAEAMSNPVFQELLDGFDLGARKNKRVIAKYYNYREMEGGFVKSLLREVLDAFDGVLSAVQKLLSHSNRTILQEAMILGSNIQTNRFSLGQVDEITSVASMDISMFNPKLLIDQADEFSDLDTLPFLISRRLSEEGFTMNDEQYSDFTGRISEYIKGEVAGGNPNGIEAQTLKVVYFKTTDSFLVTHNTLTQEGKLLTKRQFFNRFGNKESLNTNVFNGEKESHLKKFYTLEDMYSPLMDADQSRVSERKVADNFMRAVEEGFSGTAALELNEEKIFGGKNGQFRGEIEIVYTYGDGSRAVIGYAPDLAKPRLARMLKLGATIPVRMSQEGPGSKAYVLYNVPGDSSSGIKRALNPKSLKYQMTEQMVQEGYQEVRGFMPRTVFRFDVANVRVEKEVTEIVDVQDNMTSMDENLPIDWSVVKDLSDQNYIRHEFDQNIADSVLGEGFSWYKDLDSRKEFDERSWFFRDKIKREIRYRAMAGIYTAAQLKHAVSAMVSMASQELKSVQDISGTETERAERLGFADESDFLDFIHSITDEKALENYASEAASGIKQDWSGHGLNPNETVFAMVKAQIEHLSYNDPKTGKKQVLSMDKAREVLLMASRESTSFQGMIGKLLEIQKDPKLDQVQKEVAKSLYAFYSQPVTDPLAMKRLAKPESGITEKLLAEISLAAASKASGVSSFKEAIDRIRDTETVEDAAGNILPFPKDAVKTAAMDLSAYYSNPSASYNGLVRYFGSNSLFTAFASLRKVDSIAIIPVEGGGSVISYNGKSRIRDEKIAENDVKIRRVLEGIKAGQKDSKSAMEVLHQRIKDKYTELFGERFGPFPSEFNNLGTALYWNQFFGTPERLNNLSNSGSNGINDHWMQHAKPEVYGKMARVLKSFYAAFDIDIPDGVFLRNRIKGDAYLSDREKRLDLEFLEEMSDSETVEGTPEYEKAFREYQEYKRKYLENLKSSPYSYPVSKFGKKFNPKDRGKSGHYPMMALALQSAFFINTKALSYMNGDVDAELVGNEMKKLSEEQLFFGRINQSDEMYFDPKGNKRFSIKIKSQADSMMENLAMNREGQLDRMLGSDQWEHNTVLRKISENRGKPIDVMISGLRTWTKGMIYSESTDIDFVFTNLAAFTSLYDYSGDYIHVDDIPSDKPTIYGYRLTRLTPDQFETEIDRINQSERRKRIAAKNLLREAFTSEITRRKGSGAEIKNKAVFDTLVEGVHYVVRDGKYYPGKILDPSESYFKGDRKSAEIIRELKREASSLYTRMARQGLKIPLNRSFIQENDPHVILDNLKKELSQLNDKLEIFPDSNFRDNWENRISELEKAIPKKEANLAADRRAYEEKAEKRRKEIFIDEFYPNYSINRYHLSRLLMGDSVFYKDVFDMNKRKAGPAAPFYRGSWKREKGKLVALEDIGDNRDKTLVELPSVVQDEVTGQWKVVENANTVETARTDAQGYVTEQFAQEMVDAYGGFSGFKKIFKPVMFGVNREFTDRGQPLYMKLSVAVIPDPNNPKNEAHFEKYPNQRSFAEKFYASGGDIALFRTGVKAGFRNQSRVEDQSYAVQEFDLDKFGLQNDPEKSVEGEEQEIAGGVQLHKQLADNGNFQDMVAYYQIESEILRRQLDESVEKGELSSLEKLRENFIAQLEGKDHTAELGSWLRDNQTELFDHPFTSESVQNMVQSLFNKLGTLPKKPGLKLVNLSDFGYDQIMPTQNDLDKTRLFVEREVYPSGFEAKAYTPKWLGPRKAEDLHRLDQKEFKTKTEKGIWSVNEETGYIEDSNGTPVIFPADVLVPENANIPLGSRLINTRIPTTGKASNIPSRVVGYLPAELGNVIVTPKHGPGILGFDFDVDGLFAWVDTGGKKREMDSLFAIAFKVLTDAKNYNEITSPVGTDKLKASANFFSVSESEAKKAYDNGEQVSEGESNPNGWLDYGFGRQLEMMKMNSIGKVFIGASASFSAIYSVFSQTGTRLMSNGRIIRLHNAPGANNSFPQYTQKGERITDIFVQLINAATDNVKEMLLAKNNINLVTGDVLMDMVAHGIDLDYAMAFINQPAIRDLVRLHDRNDSVTTAEDFMPAEDRLIQQYERAARLVDPAFRYQPEIFREKAISDANGFSLDQLMRMYFSGNKKLMIQDVVSLESLREFIGNNSETELSPDGLLENLHDQIRVIEKFKFYKMLSGVTRSGGNLVMMFSKNPKNYTELKKIEDKIINTFYSESPKLSDHVIRLHPSYKFQLDLVRRNRRYYEDKMLVAFPEIEAKYLDSVIQDVGISNLGLVHDAFMNSLVLKNLGHNGIDSSILTGTEMTSLEFAEFLVRFLKDSREEFAGNKFMQQLTFNVSDHSISDISRGIGSPSTIEFNGTRQFTETEIREIQDSYYDIPGLEYDGREVNIKMALVYYLAITRGFSLGGYNFSKILPNGEGSVLHSINETIRGFKELYESVELRETGDEFDESEFESLLAETLDPYLVDGMDDFRKNFHMRNDQFKPRTTRASFGSMLRGSVSHFDQFSGNQVDPEANYSGSLKITREDDREVFSFASYKKNTPEYDSFLAKAQRFNGFQLEGRNGETRVFVYDGERIYRNNGYNNTEYRFVERINKTVPGLYEPYYHDRDPKIIYKKQTPKNRGVDISGSKKHRGEKSPVLLGYFEKDMRKFAQATKLIARGSESSSSQSYAEAAGPNVANTQRYESGDVVGVSAEGNRKGRIGPDFAEIERAIAVGAEFITDLETDRNRPYNVGERDVAGYLEDRGYYEYSPGRWKKDEAFIPWKDRVIYADQNPGDVMKAIDKGSVIVSESPQIIPLLLQSGYRASTKNPAAFFPKNRHFSEFNKEQEKILKNEC